jgi:hypothetical protein
MRKLSIPLIVGSILFLLIGCATVENVQRASDIIRMDNKLNQLLNEVDSNNKVNANGSSTDKDNAEIELNAIADQAKIKADALGKSRDSAPDAIAYYRIAATAYWRCNNKNKDNDDNLIEATDNGTQLCSDLGDKQPDRDCMYLKLVIPYACLESIDRKIVLNKSLGKVCFTDGNATKEEIEIMNTYYQFLVEIKPIVQKILEASEDNRYLNHEGMRNYYCNNAKKAVSRYTGIVKTFKDEVGLLQEYCPMQRNDLDITEQQINDLDLSKGIPDFCPK